MTPTLSPTTKCLRLVTQSFAVVRCMCAPLLACDVSVRQCEALSWRLQVGLESVPANLKVSVR